MAMQIVPPVNISIPTKIGSKMGGAPKTQKWDPMGFDPQPNVCNYHSVLKVGSPVMPHTQKPAKGVPLPCVRMGKSAKGCSK